MNTSSGKSSSRISFSQAGRPEVTSHEQPSRKSRAWKILSHIIDYGVPLAISVLLVVWLFKKVDFHEMMQVIHDGCNFWWVFLMMAITTISHMIRGVRWGIQLRGAGVPRMPFLMECVPIFGAYALNLVFPFLGEAWRCVYISDR
ncbi:MAG: flippase-like domain-containing protein, partial [Muribaculaceae bacterium]|nr:flippase-like domain-containing protein [Muribaculaceae bacterium]